VIQDPVNFIDPSGLEAFGMLLILDYIFNVSQLAVQPKKKYLHYALVLLGMHHVAYFNIISDINDRLRSSMINGNYLNIHE
jgi:hypothetical protein